MEIINYFEDFGGVIINIELTPENRPVLVEIQKLFKEIGITFDTGVGLQGLASKDWFFDFSLSGPIKLTPVKTTEWYRNKDKEGQDDE